jgi:hypothetical protein
MDKFDLKKYRHLLDDLTEPSIFVKSYNGVVDELNSLGQKYGVDISNCIRVEKGRHGVAFRITESVKAAGENTTRLMTEIFLAMHRNHLFPLEFVFVETEAKEVYKFINYNVFLCGDSLSTGPRIIKASLDNVPLSKPYYQTLEDLTNFDSEFIELKKTNYQWSVTIAKPENIVNAKDFVLTKNEGDTNSMNALLLMHSVSGNRGRNHFTGVHHIELPIPAFIKDFVVVRPPDKNGVYIATFKIEKRNGRVIPKKEASTMFPIHWSIQQFYFECYHALENKISVNGSSTHFKSATHSGVPVEIYFSKQGRFRTIYPIYNGLQV